MDAKALSASPPVVAASAQRWGAVVLLVATLGAAVLLMARSFLAIDADLAAAAYSRRETIAHLVANTLTEKFSGLRDLGLSFATRVRFRELVADGRWSEAIAILASVPQDFPEVERVFLTDIDGTLRADVPSVPAMHGRSFADRDWYRGVSRDWQPYVSAAYTRAAHPQYNVFAAAAPIRTADGRAVGILVLQMKLDVFFDWTRDLALDGLELAVVDHAGTVAFDSTRDPQAPLVHAGDEPAFHAARIRPRGVTVFAGAESGAERLVAHAPVAPFGWGVTVAQPLAAADAPRRRLLTSVAVAYALVLLLVGAGAHLLTRRAEVRRELVATQVENLELERRVADRTAALEAANRDLEAFGYSVAHDLRAPLRAIDGYARVLDDELKGTLTADTRRYLESIVDNAERMHRLIEDIFALSRLSRARLAPVPVDMGALADEVFAELIAIGASTSPRWTRAPLPPALADASLVRQVWVNLLGNALKFSRHAAEPAVEVSARALDGLVEYEVRDNGAGFDMKYADKLFEPFQRLHSQGEFTGSGVGLSLVKRIVARHGGRVSAEGSVGRGAVFRFTLPAAATG